MQGKGAADANGQKLPAGHLLVEFTAVPSLGQYSPAGHGEHDAAPIALRVPAGQRRQPVEPLPTAKDPPAQAVQGEPGSEENVPAGQLVQLASPEATPCPAAQGRHAALLAAPMEGLKVPALQGAHEALLVPPVAALKVPAAHAAQLDCPVSGL